MTCSAARWQPAIQYGIRVGRKLVQVRVLVALRTGSAVENILNVRFRGCVAVPAGHFHMAARQRKPGLEMSIPIEIGRFERLLVMTVFASISIGFSRELGTVGILVTCFARYVPHSINSPLYIRFMTFAAGSLNMRTFQWKSGFLMLPNTEYSRFEAVFIVANITFSTICPVVKLSHMGILSVAVATVREFQSD